MRTVIATDNQNRLASPFAKDILVPESDLQFDHLPASMLMPIRFTGSSAHRAGLFLPFPERLPACLLVDHREEAHLVHLEGEYAFHHGTIEDRRPIRGLLLPSIEFRLDPSSRYDAVQQIDRPGSVVLRGGELFLCCRLLGDRFSDDTHQVALGSNYRFQEPEDQCGFTRWSIVLHYDERPRSICSIEAV